MNAGRRSVRDLVEEGKKRIVLLFICIIGLSYLMSLTSSSVWINLPVAASLVILLRYVSYDLEMQRKSDGYKKGLLVNEFTTRVPLQGPKGASEWPEWRSKVNSPSVEAAMDQFSQHLVSEWVTDLWYSRLTPDIEGPRELLQIIHTVFGELSVRVREINLIDLLSRDIIGLICRNLELYRTCQAKIGNEAGKLNIEERDELLKQVMVSDKKLHPALISSKAEHKMLQYLMDGLISLIFRPTDLQCFLFRCTVRELLACAVMRPVMNLANPRFINERIVNLVLSLTSKADKGESVSAQNASHAKTASLKTASDKFSVFLDRSNKGLELIQLKHNPSETFSNEVKGFINCKTGDAISSSQPLFLQIGRHQQHQTNRAGREWAQMLDVISSRKIRTLTPEHFDNMWTKGPNYKKKEYIDKPAKESGQNSVTRVSTKHNNGPAKFDISRNPECSQPQNPGKIERSYTQTLVLNSSGSFVKNEDDTMHSDGQESESSYATEDDECSVTGLDSPGTKVWDSRSNRNVMNSNIHHPLENCERRRVRNGHKGHLSYHRLLNSHSGRKRSRLSRLRMPIWQEVERTSFLLGDGLDILNASKNEIKAKESSNESESDSLGRIHSGETASSSAPSISMSQPCNQQSNSSEYSAGMSSFLKLRCEVLGADIVKSGSSTFAVYSISVADANNNNWSIKRRFRHFGELHRRLKEFTEYNLNLPPKHFLSSGLDLSVVQERSKLLHGYLKKLLHLPTVSESIEVWDFLSVDSQTYVFSNSLSIIQTLSVDLDETTTDKKMEIRNSLPRLDDQLITSGRGSGINDEHRPQMKDIISNDSKPKGKLPIKGSLDKCENQFADKSASDSDSREQKHVFSSSKLEAMQNSEGSRQQDVSESHSEAVSDPSLPTEWVPPNLSVPIFNLVDVLFQLQDGGWIRRQIFWIAKQVLQLGMGDAFDDWLIEKIQFLRKGSVIASLIYRIEQILWPDGVFITKHPKHQRATPVADPRSLHTDGTVLDDKCAERNPTIEQQVEGEDARRANFVREIMIDNAPAALVSLVGRKEYQRSAQDVYLFLQSSICLKQLMFELLELLLLSAFPELENIIKQCHEEEWFNVAGQ